MLAWGITLIRLYSNLEHSDKLLPNKGLFKVHACLLIGYLVFLTLRLIISEAAEQSNNKIIQQNILNGTEQITIVIYNTIQMITFFLVVKIMLPITPTDKESRKKFKKFIFNGFADKS